MVHVSVMLTLMPCGTQDCVHGASAIQRTDQGVCFLTSAAHDSWSRPCQHHVHAKGETSFVLAQTVNFISSDFAHTQNVFDVNAVAAHDPCCLVDCDTDGCNAVAAYSCARTSSDAGDSAGQRRSVKCTTGGHNAKAAYPCAQKSCYACAFAGQRCCAVQLAEEGYPVSPYLGHRLHE
jgi:hypothetical protein